jgi:hypothetical protein
VKDLAADVRDTVRRAETDTDSWAELSRDLAERYYVQLDGRDPRRHVRYTAVARSLDIRPYAVVTGDADELRQALVHRSTTRTSVIGGQAKP